MSKQPFEIANTIVYPGKRIRIELPVAKLYDCTEITIPVEIFSGKEEGPVLFLSAALHGDEINGVEIIKRILRRHKLLENMKGTLIAVPVVNKLGFNNGIRYLPDRRDLNRCFPGSLKGSLAHQIAYVFLNEIVQRSTHGIDFHTGAIHRTNLPQIRASLEDSETVKIAEAFGAPVIINTKLVDGSLRNEMKKMGIPLVLFEGGEALRYEENIIKSGINGALSVMKAIGMFDPDDFHRSKKKSKDVFVAKSSYWVRAPHSGSLRFKKKLGSRVKKGEILGIISDPFGLEKHFVKAIEEGIIIGMSLLPLVNNGNALFHIATFKDISAVEESVEEYEFFLENLD